MKTTCFATAWLCWQFATTLFAAETVTPASDQLERLRQNAVDHPQDATAQKRLAAQCLKEYLEPEALTAAGAAVALAPNDGEANGLYVTALARSGRYQEAIDARVIDIRGTSASVKKVMDAAGLAKQAEDLLAQAATRNEGEVPAPVPALATAPRGRPSKYNPLGTTSQISRYHPLGPAPSSAARSDYEEAARLLEKAGSLDPDNLAIRLTLGWVYLDKLHDPHAANSHVAFVARRHPGDANARKLFGLASLQLGRPEQAVVEFRAASQLEPEDLWVQASLAKSLARTGRFREAGKIYSDVLAKDPANADARLGQSELLAWRGYSAEPLATLDQLIGESPTNAEALVLRGDIHRWDWDLTEAKDDYRAALALNENNYEARSGLEQAQWMGGFGLSGKGYQFEDTAGFRRQSVGAGVRIPLIDRAYLLGDAAGWRFHQNGGTDVDRFDGSGGLEIHWARWLETTAEADSFSYEHRATFIGAHGAAKLTLAPGFDVYANGAYRQPFVSSVFTVTNNLKQDSAGGGLDFHLFGPFSVQNSLELAKISDGNKWWEEKPQLSLRVSEALGLYLRVQYDYLSYKQTSSNYFSPRHWNALGPGVGVALPLVKNVRILAEARAPYIFDESKFGGQLETGPAVQLTRMLRLNGMFIISSIPGDQGTWSGHGWQASASLRF